MKTLLPPQQMQQHVLAVFWHPPGLVCMQSLETPGNNPEQPIMEF